MKQKHYIAIAQAIKENTVYGSSFSDYPAGYFTIAFNPFVDTLCDILAADNKNFDKNKFMEACK